MEARLDAPDVLIVGAGVVGNGVVVRSSGVLLGADVTVATGWMLTFENSVQPKIVKLMTSMNGMILFGDMDAPLW